METEKEWGKRSVGGAVSGCLFAAVIWVAILIAAVAVARLG